MISNSLVNQELLISPKISVIIVVRNGEDLIKAAIESVLDQDYKNYELIVIDGLSTDRTMQIVSSFSKQIHHLESKADGGLYYAMNDGIRIASGELISIIGCDDEFTKDAFQSVANVFVPNKLQIIYGDMEYVDRSENRILTVSKKSFPKTMIPHPTCFLDQRTMTTIAPFDVSYRIAADLDFMIRANQFGAILTKIEGTLIRSTSNGYSSQNRNKYISIREELRIRNQYKVGKPLPNKLRYIVYFLGISFFIVTRTFVRFFVNLGRIHNVFGTDLLQLADDVEP